MRSCCHGNVRGGCAVLNSDTCPSLLNVAESRSSSLRTRGLGAFLSSPTLDCDGTPISSVAPIPSVSIVSPFAHSFTQLRVSSLDKASMPLKGQPAYMTADRSSRPNSRASKTSAGPSRHNSRPPSRAVLGVSGKGQAGDMPSRLMTPDVIGGTGGKGGKKRDLNDVRARSGSR